MLEDSKMLEPALQRSIFDTFDSQITIELDCQSLQQLQITLAVLKIFLKFLYTQP